jgi:hypothetical protein
MKLLFIPVSIVGGLVAGAVGKKLFDGAWGLIDAESAPEPEVRNVAWGKLLVAAALQGAIFRLAKVAVDHGSRQAFLNATGTWPGEEEPDSA